MPCFTAHSRMRTLPAWHLIVATTMTSVLLSVSVACDQTGSDAARVDANDAVDAVDAVERSQVADAPSFADIDAAAQAIETLINATRTHEAELIARKLCAQVPSDSPHAARVYELAARAYFARAELAKHELEPAAIKTLIADAARAAQQCAHIGEPDAVRLRFAALLADRMGNHRESATLYDQALAVKPDDLLTLLPAASSAIGSKDFARARALIERHRTIAPTDAWSEGIAAELAIAELRFADAVRCAQASVALDRDRVEFRLILARALRLDQRASESARVLGALEPEVRARIPVAQQFALALTACGDFAAAAQAWNSALRANPNDPFVRAETALAFHRAGDEARAAAELTALDAMRGGPQEHARIAPALIESSSRAP